VLHAAVETDAGDQVRAMFQRVLAAWAVDALSLRRRGLHRPSQRCGAGFALASPGWSDAATDTGGLANRGEPGRWARGR
jgi:hypothetical protein